MEMRSSWGRVTELLIYGQYEHHSKHTVGTEEGIFH